MAGSKKRNALVSVVCGDRVGLVSAVTGRLFDLGVNLGDVSFAVLGGGAEFTALCALPPGVSRTDVKKELSSLKELAAAEVSVRAFEHEKIHGPKGHITHRITLEGSDSPGLIARLSEALGSYGANIVRLDAETVPAPQGDSYIIHIETWIPEARAKACLATIANTAGELHLACRAEAV